MASGRSSDLLTTERLTEGESSATVEVEITTENASSNMSGSESHSSEKDQSSLEGVEEGASAYHPNGFHPVYIGDVFKGRYKVLNKLGYGMYSTVWLCRDLEKPGDKYEFVALKVLSAMCYGDENDIFELEILRHLRARNPKSHPGYPHICHLVDDFEHKGPNGNHVCMVFELMGESLLSFGTFFQDDCIPPPIMRRFAIQLIMALDYAHERGIIHTDISPGNVLVKMIHRDMIETEYLTQIDIADQDRAEKHYSPIKSRPLQGYYIKDGDDCRDFDIALADWGVSSWTDDHLCSVIQPLALRSPEVILGVEWDTNTDWWNLGALLLEFFQCRRMFNPYMPPDHEYDLKKHLTQIVELFGPFPRKFLNQSNQAFVEEMFNSEGRIKDVSGLATPGNQLENYWWKNWDADEGDDVKGEFLDFLRYMMKIDPSERPEVQDLLRHPWLDALPPLEEDDEPSNTGCGPQAQGGALFQGRPSSQKEMQMVAPAIVHKAIDHVWKLGQDLVMAIQHVFSYPWRLLSRRIKTE